MELTQIQSIAFDGVLYMNTSDELLQYVELVTGIEADEDEYCIVLNTKFYYPDIITPLFDIFTAIHLVEYELLTLEQQKIINQLEKLSIINKFQLGNSMITVDDILDNDDYLGVHHCYDLLGGIYELQVD
jgi:hypothetical protein